ncbi:hypothetical protein FRX31_030401 [Thalictrum thalictroides]|uniref:Endonuclease/exonuclease/phosphatase domain-containing protein n=1 Tax=Thalictrum thalictroides TaxID=46969 RepID=A0A7J6V727_THATH|nr:hypothetical protein FRX31_030401 [Thalictrum thalictroides]
MRRLQGTLETCLRSPWAVLQVPSFGLSGGMGNEKLHFFEELDNIRAWAEAPWVIGGDFNITIFSHERSGNRDRVAKFTTLFDDFVNRHALVDFALKGAHFTD